MEKSAKNKTLVDRTVKVFKDDIPDKDDVLVYDPEQMDCVFPLTANADPGKIMIATGTEGFIRIEKEKPYHDRHTPAIPYKPGA